MIIGIGGARGSGKNTLAEIIIEQYPQFKQIAFVDPLKDFIIKLFDLNGLDGYDAFKRDIIQWREHQYEGRLIVQEIGMMMLKLQPTIFIDYAISQLMQHPNLIITDVRMPHEISWIRQYSNKLIYMKGKTSDQKDKHITENAVKENDFDLIIYNTDTKEFLKHQLELCKEVFNA